MSENPTPSISVLMSVYNGERFIKEALDSIINQTFTDFEIILIDDASTDNTPQILGGYTQENLIKITNSKNLGLTRSLNKALTVAQGKFIARQDADDISHPERFRRQSDFLLASPEIGLLGTSYYVIDQHGQILDISRPPTADDQLRKSLERGNIFCHGSVMMRRDILEKVGGYNEYFRVTQDYDLWLRLSEHSQIANIDEILYRLRFLSESMTRKSRGLQLSYRRLARHLADQRLSGQAEGPMPDDLSEAFPPEPLRLFGDARWAAFLFYSAGQKSGPREFMHRALEIQNQHHIIPSTSWAEWALARAQDLASLRDDADQAINFIIWVFGNLPTLFTQPSVKKTIAQFYADQAFLAQETGNRKNVRRYAWGAVKYDFSWLKNRGLWIIAGKSLNS